MGSEIGAYEAKTTLPELLRQVQTGKRFTITHRGKPVAESALRSRRRARTPRLRSTRFRRTGVLILCAERSISRH